MLAKLLEKANELSLMAPAALDTTPLLTGLLSVSVPA